MSKKIKTVRLKSEAAPGTLAVYYYTFTFLNFRGDEMYYLCTATSLKLAKQQLHKYMRSAPYTVKSVSVSGPYIFYAT